MGYSNLKHISINFHTYIKLFKFIFDYLNCFYKFYEKIINSIFNNYFFQNHCHYKFRVRDALKNLEI